MEEEGADKIDDHVDHCKKWPHAIGVQIRQLLRENEKDFSASSHWITSTIKTWGVQEALKFFEWSGEKTSTWSAEEVCQILQLLKCDSFPLNCSKIFICAGENLADCVLLSGIPHFLSQLGSDVIFFLDFSLLILQAEKDDLPVDISSLISCALEYGSLFKQQSRESCMQLLSLLSWSSFGNAGATADAELCVWVVAHCES